MRRLCTGHACDDPLKRSFDICHRRDTINDWFVIHDGLIGAARFPGLARPQQRISAIELALLGWRVYAALVFAGVGANLLALSSRAATKSLGLDLGSRPFDSWWLQAIGTGRSVYRAVQHVGSQLYDSRGSTPVQVRRTALLTLRARFNWAPDVIPGGALRSFLPRPLPRRI